MMLRLKSGQYWLHIFCLWRGLWYGGKTSDEEL